MSDDEPEIKRMRLKSVNSVYFSENQRLDHNFFNVSCIDLAKNLLGTVLVRKLNDGTLLKGKIVETECYLGYHDKASHSYRGKKTPRNEPMFMKPGTLYVYQTYGMYYCMNISSQGDGAAVLLRSIEPIEGLEQMSDFRRSYHSKRKRNNNSKIVSKTSKTNYKPQELCNGPSKLTISFDINIENCNKRDLSNFSDLWIEESCDKVLHTEIISSTRIGIDSAGPEWASKLLRFYIFGNLSVSVKDKKREKLCTVSDNPQ